jgi:hypothetical protein
MFPVCRVDVLETGTDAPGRVDREAMALIALSGTLSRSTNSFS